MMCLNISKEDQEEGKLIHNLFCPRMWEWNLWMTTFYILSLLLCNSFKSMVYTYCVRGSCQNQYGQTFVGECFFSVFTSCIVFMLQWIHQALGCWVYEPATSGDVTIINLTHYTKGNVLFFKFSRICFICFSDLHLIETKINKE